MKDEVVSIGKQHFLHTSPLVYIICMHSANKILAIVVYYEKYNNITSY